MSTALFKKLNLKEQTAVYSLNHPKSFESELKELEKTIKVNRKLLATSKVEFVIKFCTKQKEVDEFASALNKVLHEDGIVWIAYPKGTSKNYKCEFNRDTGWDSLGKNGFEPVRQVAIDNDWSALRFRRVAYIKTMTRSFAMTKEGKQKVEKSKKANK